jgi:hypothetical protein
MLLAFALLRHLSHPLFRQDEAETAVFAERVLDYGYPKIHGPKNLIDSLWDRDGVRAYDDGDVYTGSRWAPYYVGALGAAWARDSDDLYSKTLRLRLPFAVLGAAGILLILFAVLPAAGATRESRLGFALCFGALTCASTSLLLHMREARDPALTVFLVGGVLCVDLRRRVFDQLGPRSHALLLGLLLVLLFNAFFPAFVILALAIGMREGSRCLRRGGSEAARAKSLLKHTAGLWLAMGMVVPLLGFFDFLGATRNAWTPTPGFVLSTLLRYEFLAPALALRVTVLALRPGAAPPARDSTLRQRLEISSFLGGLVIIYAAVGTPLSDRSFVVIGPLLIAMLLLDAFSLAAILRRTGSGTSRRRLASVGASVSALCLVASLGVRGPDLAGHLDELRAPYRNALDYAIPYLHQNYPGISDMVIAADEDDLAFVYYLGSKMTLGPHGTHLEEDRTIQPDLIVARPGSEQLAALTTRSEGARYASTGFSVANHGGDEGAGLRPHAERRVGRSRIAPEAQPALIILERQGPSPR